MKSTSAAQTYICCDNVEELRKYADNSIDAICTDAPYGLGKEPDPLKMLSAWISNGFMEVEGGGFMGKKWDAFVPQPVFWKEVFRVLKPGGHVLYFFGTRTYDWGVMAMRIAGFEIRDQIQWLYGSGFPKSLNISKSLDKQAGAEREVIGTREHPTLTDKSKIDRVGKQQFHGNNSIKDEWELTASATDQAKEWEGWGSALKPANEPIVLARKPLSEKNIAENILKWGTGGINIDGCRIGFSSEKDKKSAVFGRGTDIMGGNSVGGTHGDGRTNVPPDDLGRFPANVIFDEVTAKALDEQSGNLTSGAMKKSYEYTNTGNSLGSPVGSTRAFHEANSGGASRFFYVAKASRSERNKGLEDFDQVTGGMISNTSGQHMTRRDEAYKPEPVANIHPTVKPVKLMQYLVRMITPPGGVCLDPFCGSGTTGIACKLENIEFVGMDITPEYIEISKARTAAWELEKEDITNQLALF